MIAGTVTTNDAVALAPPESVAVTVAPAVVPKGTLTSHENAPELLVVNEPETHETAAPPNVSEARGASNENPEPSTVTGAPAGPWWTDRVIAGVVTVNVNEAVCPPTSVATTADPLV
jgi:hypothetical protein